VTTSPGLSADRPTRDDAWMYSAVFFGWPVTTISPKRETSTPTWSIEVASTTSTGVVPRRLRSRDRSASACGGRRNPPRESLESSAAFQSSAIAFRRAEVSISGSKPISSFLSAALMSVEEMREVSSAISSIRIPVNRSDRPLRWPCRRTRVVTSSSR
jgi:hypothetical protein